MAGNTRLNVSPIFERLDPKIGAQIVNDPKFAEMFIKHNGRLTLKQIDQIGRRYKDSFRPLANQMFDALATGSAGPRLKSAATRYNRAVKAATETDKIMKANNIPRMVRGQDQKVPAPLKEAVDKPITQSDVKSFLHDAKMKFLVKPIVAGAMTSGAVAGGTAGLAIGEAVNDRDRRKRAAEKVEQIEHSDEPEIEVEWDEGTNQ